MTILITIDQKGARVDSIESVIEKHIRAKYPEVRITVERKEPPESRGDRFSEEKWLIGDGKSQAGELRDELRAWLDNLPENLQQGSKADEIQSAIDSLEEFITACEEAEGIEVDFPGMY